MRELCIWWGSSCAEHIIIKDILKKVLQLDACKLQLKRRNFAVIIPPSKGIGSIDRLHRGIAEQISRLAQKNAVFSW